jgi:predicted RNA binding protein YcfA (HicA-like mRNA interferase family)
MLERLGYRVIRQKGSHIRLRHQGPPVHSISVPSHNTLKTGTLHALLTDVAHARDMDVDSIVELL